MVESLKLTTPRRGDLFLVSFDPTIGREIKKTRPALVIQNDVGNRYADLTIVAAITSKISHVFHPVEVVVQPSKANGLTVLSAVLLDQIRTVDKRRLITRLGALDTSELERVNEALQISLGLIDLR